MTRPAPDDDGREEVDDRVETTLSADAIEVGRAPGIEPQITHRG